MAVPLSQTQYLSDDTTLPRALALNFPTSCSLFIKLLVLSQFHKPYSRIKM